MMDWIHSGDNPPDLKNPNLGIQILNLQILAYLGICVPGEYLYYCYLCTSGFGSVTEVQHHSPWWKRKN